MSGARQLPAARVPTTPYTRPIPVVDDALRLDGNEGSRPPAALLRLAAEQPAEILRSYPDLDPLARAIASRHGVDPGRVVVTAGADDAMDRVFRAFAAPGSEVVVPTPTFEMVHRFAQAAGAQVRTVPWEDGFPVAEVIERLGPATGVVVVISPNNPTGGVISAPELSRVARAAGGSMVLFDHVYAEYADRDLSANALELDNVVVLRTFSKAWGLAGCRVGYALASAEIAALLRNAANPYPVAALSARIALERLEAGGDEMRAHVDRVRRERQHLRAWLGERGVRCSESQGNFLLAELGDGAAAVQDALAALGVLVRHFPNRPEIRNCLRISLPGDAAAFDRLVAALDRGLDKETER